MHEQLEMHARYLAYRWLRMNDLGASHLQAWEFASKNWANFLFEAKKHFNLEEEDLALSDSGEWLCRVGLATA